MFTAKQIADRLKVSLSSVYALLESGELRSYRCGAGGKALRVSEEQLQDFLRERETKPLPKGFKHLDV